jgi:hypothetical protein
MTSSTLQTHGNTPSQRQITVDSQSQSTNYSILSDLKSPSAKSPRLLAPYDAEQMQLQMETFLHEEIYSSAKILGEFLISLASNSSSSGSSNTGNAISSNNQSGNILGGGGTTAPVPVLSRDFHAKSFSLFADLLVAMKEYKRAIVSLIY